MRPAVVVVLALALCGCGQSGRLSVLVETEDRAPLRFGVPLADDPARLRRQYAPLLRELARGTARPVDLVVTSTYRSVGWLLEQGKAELGWFSGVAFLRVSRSYPAVALGRAVRRGTTTYVGEILVLADSPILSVEDLRGKRLAYVDPESGSGFVAANQVLLDAGLSPGADLADTGFTHAHLTSMKALVAKRYDAAATFEDATNVYKAHFPPNTFRVLARSGPLPNDVVACSPRLDAGVRAAVARTLLEMTQTESGKKALAEMAPYSAIDAFVAP